MSNPEASRSSDDAAAKSGDTKERPGLGERLKGLLGFQVGDLYEPPEFETQSVEFNRREELKRENFLKALRPRLGERRELLLGCSTVLAVVAALLLAITASTAAFGAFRATAVIGSGASLALVATYLLRQRMRETSEQITEIDYELDRFKIDKQPVERRAQKLLQIHSVELKRYYDQTLRQGAYIFWVGLLCLIAGFVIIGVALAQVIKPRPPEYDKTVVAVVGLTGGVLSNFVGFIFMRMYSQAIGSMSRFHERLVTTHHLHFGNFLAARISPKNSDAQNRTLEAMANALAGPPTPATGQQALAFVPVAVAENGAPPGRPPAQSTGGAPPAPG